MQVFIRNIVGVRRLRIVKMFLFCVGITIIGGWVAIKGLYYSMMLLIKIKSEEVLLYNAVLGLTLLQSFKY